MGCGAYSVVARVFCPLGSSPVLTYVRTLRATLLPRCQNPSR